MPEGAEVFTELAQVYALAAARGMGAADVAALDDLEVWQVAGLLGVTTPAASADAGETEPAAGEQGGPYLTGEALLRARERHARGQGPKPRARPAGAGHPVLGGLGVVSRGGPVG